MRIFLTLHPSGNFSVRNSKTWLRNFYEPLLDLGHDVFLLNIEEFCKSKKIKFRTNIFKEIFSHEIIKEFNIENNKKPFDLLISYLTSNDIEIQALKELRKFGIPMANFSCNNTHQFYLIKEISPLFDFNLYSEKNSSEKFKSINSNGVWFQMAANPKYFYPKITKRNIDVSFIGSAYSKRPHYINHLAKKGINVECYGPNWLINKPFPKIKKIKKEIHRNLLPVVSLFNNDQSKKSQIENEISQYDLLKKLRRTNKAHFHYPPSDELLLDIINKSKINMGFLEVEDEETNNIISHLHLREFEVPMSGGLYITNYSSELAEFYIPEKEVITFNSENELVDKINYYLNNENQAEIIRKNAYLRSLNEHTYQKRFNNLFQKLNIK
jgi:spore maturation protein CgeB